MSPEALTIIGIGIVLAVLITWLRADVKSDRAEAAADQRAFQPGTDDFHYATQFVAERQSHVKWPFDTTTTADD